jgi:beta-glucosidase
VTAEIGRLLMPAIRWSEATGFEHERGRITEALQLGVGGFIFFGGPPDEVAGLIREIRARAAEPLLMASDLERGAGQQFPGLREIPPPAALAALGDLDAVRAAGRVTGRDAALTGLDWVFAPDADLDCEPQNPIVQTRAFGADPATVSRCVTAWIEGCTEAGVLSCAKHFPGHGRTTTDSHAGLPVVRAGREELEQDLAPFRAAIVAGVPAVMTAHVAFPALDPSGAPATLSSSILGMLRRDLGFGGVIVSDALIMEGAFEGRSEGDAYVEAVAAGVDILLYPKELATAHAALRRAVGNGRLHAGRLADAVRRREHLLVRLHDMRASWDGPPIEGHPGLADRLLALPLARGSAPSLREPIELVIVDDDLGGPYPVSPSDWVARALGEAGIALGTGGSRVVLLFSEPRAWKGRAGLGVESATRLADAAVHADLVALFGHPRLVSAVPGHGPVMVTWHRQRLMQEALARWIVARVRR